VKQIEVRPLVVVCEYGVSIAGNGEDCERLATAEVLAGGKSVGRFCDRHVAVVTSNLTWFSPRSSKR
jgi:hypothetical protein